MVYRQARGLSPYMFLRYVAGIKSYDTVWDLVKTDHAAICLKVELYTKPSKR